VINSTLRTLFSELRDALQEEPVVQEDEARRIDSTGQR